MFESLNRSVVLAGTTMTLLLAVPAAITSSVLSDDGAENQSNWTLLAALVVMIGYLLGGALAGRAIPSAPFANGAAATLLAFALIQGVGIILRLSRGDDISIVALVFNGLLAASIGTFGAWFGVRWAARFGPPRWADSD